MHHLHRRLPADWTIQSYEPDMGLDYPHAAFIVGVPDFHLLRPEMAAARGEPHVCDQVPSDVLAFLQSGKGRLLIDMSNEAPEVDDLACGYLADWLVSADIDPARVIYLSANARLASDVAAFGMDAALFDFFNLELAYKFRRELRGELRKLELVWPRRDWSSPMLCLNETPRGHRVALMACLAADGFAQSHFVSWGGWKHSKAVGLADLALAQAREILAAGAPDALPFLDAVACLDRVSFEDAGSTGNELAFEFPSVLYASSAFSLVSESGVSPGVHRLSEKSIKALAGGHLPVIWGSEKSRSLLEAYGFDPIAPDHVWSYDLVEPAGARLSALREVYRGCIDRTLVDPGDHVDQLLGNIAFAHEGFEEHLWNLMGSPLMTALTQLD